ncbi:MAG: FAD-dependent oxidoreductase [Tissierellia bacterium]|nr:FAD-dependent oxidoreductase [Tissierellia bacterium]
MINILDLFTNTQIKLIDKKREAGDKYVFYFKPISPIDWKAGQDGIFTFRGKKIEGKSLRIFTVASSPDEKNIIISTIIVDKPSDFKDKMRAMEIGDSMFLRGPFGIFVLPNYNKKVALIAGGIGITPMRAILKDLEDKDIPMDVTLFYVDSKKDFVFKEVLEASSSKNSKIKVRFFEDRDSFTEELSKYVEQNKNDSLYFISGTPKMVKGIRMDLKNKEILNQNIVSHRLLGYK